MSSLAGTNSAVPGMTTFSSLPNHPTSPEKLILARLEYVKEYGKGWRARCPAHDGKSVSSLSINVAEDGRCLIHCFGGCGVLTVLHSIGLEGADLYPKRETRDMTPAELRQFRQQAKQSQWAAAVEVLELEARIVAVAADQIAAGEPLNEKDRQRLGQALERITGARLVLSGR